jgi:hypothetical protein
MSRCTSGTDRPPGPALRKGLSCGILCGRPGAAGQRVFRRVRDEYISLDRPPASSLVQVSGLVNPEFRMEIEALAVI